MTEATTTPIAALILDYNLYPRSSVDSVNVTDIVQAMKAGNFMPPVIADKKSKRVIDGFHRVTAMRRLHGDDASIEVVWRTYRNDAEMFTDAVRLNAGHGRRLGHFDQTHVAIRSQELGIDPEVIASAMSITVERFESVLSYKTASVAETLTPIPLKRTFGKWAGSELSPRQIEANNRASGMSLLFYVNQVINILGIDTAALKDETVADRLKELGRLIDESLAVTAA